MSIRTALIAQLRYQRGFGLRANNSIRDDSGAHLETCDGLSRFRAIFAVGHNSIPKHLKRLLKTANRVNLGRR